MLNNRAIQQYLDALQEPELLHRITDGWVYGARVSYPLNTWLHENNLDRCLGNSSSGQVLCLDLYRPTAGDGYIGSLRYAVYLPPALIRGHNWARNTIPALALKAFAEAKRTLEALQLDQPEGSLVVRASYTIRQR